MSNLLEKASIILTPTAYNNGEALCVKPSDGSGDFDFSRNSAATRVNAQGLVENVQILSSNLVQNGDFSEEGSEEVSNGSFSQEGSELITNGDFSNGLTDWSVVGGSYASVNNGILNSNNTVNGSWFGQYIAQDVSFVNGKTYKVTFIAKNISGGLNLRLTQSANVVANLNLTSEFVSYTYYYTSNADNGSLRMFCNDAVGQFEIDNVSVREVGQDWTLGTGWSIGEDKAVADGTTNNAISQTTISSVVGKSYKIDFTIDDYVTGNIRIYFGGVFTPFVNANGVYSFYIAATAVDVLATSASGLFNGSITNISVKEVGQNWELQTGWSIGNDVVTTDGTIGKYFLQVGVLEIGKTYKYSFDVLNNGNGIIDGRLRDQITGSVFNFSSEGTYTGTFTSLGTFFNIVVLSNNTTSFSVTNISVIEITTDTSLPRINYEGFSYDGSGNVVPDSGCGSWLFEPQSTNLIEYSEDFSQWTFGGDTTIESGYLAPDGTNNAYKVSGTDNNIKVTVANLLGTSQRTIFARTVSGTGTAKLFTHRNNTNNLFNITEQWQRFELNSTTEATSEETFFGIDFRGGSLSEIILWGANATNDQDYVTSYIPSNGSTVTRNQDVCTNGGSLASINSTEGTLYAEIAALADDGTSRNISISDGTYSNTILLRYLDLSNKIQAVVRIGNSFKGICDFTLADTTENIKVAYKWKNGDFALWINGTEVDTSFDIGEFAPNILTELSFDRGDGTQNFFGKTKALAVWKEALSDSELQSLTTI